MRIVKIVIDGYGKLVKQELTFDAEFNVVVGENEAGKSTLSSAILALLYGHARGEKERWRPWAASSFSASLIYTLANGATFEVRRDFDRDSKGVFVYDEHGNDASAACAVGKAIIPGEAHLGLPLEVFTNASFVAQGAATIDGSRAELITQSLAHALDGGPREDAAMGAINRLDAALTLYVGRKKATVNAPLRHLQEEALSARNRAQNMRDEVAAVEAARLRLMSEQVRLEHLQLKVKRLESQGKAWRAYSIRSRLESLREVRDDLSALGAERAKYDDVSAFPTVLVPDLESSYQEWLTASALQLAQADEAHRNRMTAALQVELDERECDGGALNDDAFGNLEALAEDALVARDAAIAAADAVQTARRNVDGGGEVFGLLLVIGVIAFLCGAALFGFGRPIASIPCFAVACALFAYANLRWRRRGSVSARIRSRQREADLALARERDAAARVAAIVEPLGVASLDALTRLRGRAAELRSRKGEATRLAGVAEDSKRRAKAAAKQFDEIAALAVEPSGSRAIDLANAKKKEARKRTSDGLDLRLSMLAVRRADLLGGDEEYEVHKELEQLVLDGVRPECPPDGLSVRTNEAELSELRRRIGESERISITLESQIQAAEANIGDLASLDERVASLALAIHNLERFEAAITLARDTIDSRTKEAHQKFARRLSDYASEALGTITFQRYTDLRVDPTTLMIKIRSPENGAIVDVGRLSAGTREQAYLVTRLSMAKMFSEGLETAPLLLDDPFAYWDEERIARSLPILESYARNGSQLTIFTTSEELSAAACLRGAKRIALPNMATS